MRTLDRALLQELLVKAGDHLSGRWVLIGGMVLPALGVEYRTTTDVDLVGMGEEEHKQILGLMEVAEFLHLPVETINQAGAYFLHKIPGYEKELILLHEGKNAKIYRPSLFLFWQLKLSRFSQSDCDDCIEFYRYSLRNNEVVHKKELMKMVEAAEKGVGPHSLKIKQFEKLKNLLSES
jgi:hypothetical protein